MIAAIADWFVAIGTLCLAGATVWLVLVTKDMVQRSSQQLALEQRRIEASQPPHVYPESPIDRVDGRVTTADRLLGAKCSPCGTAALGSP